MGTEGRTLADRAHAPGRTRGPDHTAAGEGHHETAGQGIRETQEAGQGADQRGSGREYVHVYGVHSGAVYPRAEQHEHRSGKGSSKLAIPRASLNFPEFSRSCQPTQVNYMTLSPRPGVDWLSGSSAAPGRGVNITRQWGVSLDDSTRSSPSGTSMSISSNSKLKAALTWAGQTMPAVALFSPPTPPQFLAFGEGHLDPAVAAGNGAFDRDFSGHFPNITTADQGGGSEHARKVFSVNFYLGCGEGKSLHPGGPRNLAGKWRQPGQWLYLEVNKHSEG